MIPYSYNMVDMGGIDLAEANGTVVPGVYEKIVEAMNLCGDLILYNWKFASINIPPSACSVLQQASSILINGLIQVTELDKVTVIGLPPPPVPVSPLEVTENGTYEAEPPASGFNPVTVNVVGGEYVRVRVYSADSTLYEEYFESGSQVSINEVIVHENSFRTFSFEGVLRASLNIDFNGLPATPTNFSIVQSYMVESMRIVGNDLEIVPVVGVGAAGVVFSGESDVTLIYTDYDYRQCGRATLAATLPNIQNTGAGRTYYTTPGNNAQTAISFVTGQNFFASGAATAVNRKLTIKNFIKEEQQ